MFFLNLDGSDLIVGKRNVFLNRELTSKKRVSNIGK